MKIIPKMSDSDYRKIDALAQSRLSLMCKSPMHYKLNPQIESDALAFGTIFHMALLEPTKFRESFLVEPSEITIEGKKIEVNKRIAKHREYLETWRMDNVASTIITEKQMDSLTGMLGEVARDPELVEFISLGTPEVVSLFDYRGRPCKARADIVVDHPRYGKVIVDFKKTQDASESGFTRSVYNYKYNLQSAFYSEAFKIDRFFFVAVEERGFTDNKGNNRNAIGKWDAALWMESGKKLMDRLIDKLEICEKTNEWGWYSNGFEQLRPPAWTTAIDDEQE